MYFMANTDSCQGLERWIFKSATLTSEKPHTSPNDPVSRVSGMATNIKQSIQFELTIMKHKNALMQA